ncbi:sensor histidine kinase [Bacillus sp. ISL-75]|uniref:ATP-binding protein n=1 Tax=Bacillus sp. ISL-75 TaxID=2819137 RepID=UPI001BEB4475|nr:ATP-binding protein [Bacillus sp. ISL-75]MBT2727213.1 sensor histidine kinase [Bacillus sp. ISL-75]
MGRKFQWLFHLFSHGAWWYITVISVSLFLYSETQVYDWLLKGCEGKSCTDLFLLSSGETESLQAYGISMSFYSGILVVLLLIQFLSFFTAGCLLYVYGMRDRICLYTSIMLIATGTIMSVSNPLILQAPHLQSLFKVESFVGEIYLFFFFLFPDGRFRPRWLWVPAFIGLGGNIGTYFFPGSIMDPLSWPTLTRTGTWIALHLLVIFSQIYRYRHAETKQLKRQIRWFAVSMSGFILSVLALLLSTSYSEDGLVKLCMWFVYYLALLCMPFSIGIAILEQRQRHLSTLFSRTIVYSFVTIVVMGVYVLIIGSLGLLFNYQNNIFISLLATGIVAVIFQPLREKVQQSVNRLVYGDRDDPYKILSSLTKRLELTMSNSSVLPTIVEEVAKALKLPFAAIDIKMEGQFQRVASFGQEIQMKSEFPLTIQQECIGTLIVGARSLQETLPPEKVYMLNDLFRQVTLAVQTVRITRELQHSRIKLVSLREEERQRMRRDLHDGLGASLASISLKMDTLIFQNEVDQTVKNRLLELQDNLRTAIGNIRQLVYNLRPPALDELGFIFAMDELSRQFEDSKVKVSIEAGNIDFQLHAAIEVAAYRIAQEAITNAVKHSKGSICKIILETDDTHLTIFIEDDGIGLPENRKSGIGLHSMRERAEEVGGEFFIKKVDDIGTTVKVRLPLWMEGN